MNLTVAGMYPFISRCTAQLTRFAATVSSAFDPPEGQAPYSYVFDLTGEIRWDRPEEVSPCIVPWLHPSNNMWNRCISVTPVISPALLAQKPPNAMSSLMSAYNTRSTLPGAPPLKRKITSSLKGSMVYGGTRRCGFWVKSKSKCCPKSFKNILTFRISA